MRLRSIALRPDCELDVAGLWTVLRIYRYTQVFRTARLSDIGKNLRVPYEILEPTVDRLVAQGYALRDGDHLGLTRVGLQQVRFVTSLIQEWVSDKLSRSPAFEGRPERGEIEAALQRIAHRALVDRDWSANEAEFAGTAHADGKAD